MFDLKHTWCIRYGELHHLKQGEDHQLHNDAINVNSILSTVTLDGMLGAIWSPICKCYTSVLPCMQCWYLISADASQTLMTLAKWILLLPLVLLPNHAVLPLCCCPSMLLPHVAAPCCCPMLQPRAASLSCCSRCCWPLMHVAFVAIGSICYYHFYCRWSRRCCCWWWCWWWCCRWCCCCNI